MNNSVADKMAADEFDRVAKTCNWSTRSLNVVRSILVDGNKPVDVAREQDPPMTYQQVYVLKKRFLDKALAINNKKITAQDFMRTVKPNTEIALEPFRRELQQLLKNGYSNDQLLLYLLKNGIDTSPEILNNFLSQKGK